MTTTLNFECNEYLNQLEKRFKQEIESTFDSIKESSSSEEMAYHRGLMNGVQYCLQVVEVMKNKGNV